MESEKMKGWSSTTIKEINIRKSKNVNPAQFPEEQFESYSVPIFPTGKPEIVKGESIKSSKQLVSQDEVLLCKINPRINRVWQVGNYSSHQKIASSEWIIINTNKIIPTNYLRYLFSAPFFRKLMQQDVSGVGGSLTRARPKIVENYPFPLPPLAEQNRIVTKLDKLFGHLDLLKERLDRIPKMIEDFRQSVLNQAVSGKLTEEWRAFKLGDLGDWKGGGTPSKSNKNFWTNGQTLWITPKDMKDKFLDDSKMKITTSAVKGSSANLIPLNSILIVTRSGILRRILPIALNLVETTVNQDLKTIVLNKEFYPKFILYSLISQEGQIRINCMKSGTTVESVETSLLKEYVIYIPTFLKQKEIVRRIESLFAKSDTILARYEQLRTQIEHLPQAFLAKAFRGELVPQLPEDGDARELLEEIKRMKEETEGESKRKSKKKK